MEQAETKNLEGWAEWALQNTHADPHVGRLLEEIPDTFPEFPAGMDKLKLITWIIQNQFHTMRSEWGDKERFVSEMESRHPLVLDIAKYAQNIRNESMDEEDQEHLRYEMLVIRSMVKKLGLPVDIDLEETLRSIYGNEEQANMAYAVLMDCMRVRTAAAETIRVLRSEKFRNLPGVTKAANLQFRMTVA